MTPPTPTPSSPPEALKRLVHLFRDAPDDLRVVALHEHAERLPDPPADMTVDDMERVVECQSLFYLATEIDSAGRVRAHFVCPPEAPTTRGFAAVLGEGIEGAEVPEVLAVPDDLHRHLRIDGLVTEQRLGGMEAVVRRLKRQLTESSMR